MLVKHIVQQGLLFKNSGAISRAAAYHHGTHTSPTMNDLPVPAGDWQEYHSKRNGKYNAVLISGILVMAATLGFMKSSGLVVFNYAPPKSLD